jgi:hypothetical protein
MELSSPINLSADEELSPIHLARSQSFGDITPQLGRLTPPRAGGRCSAAGAIRPGNLITAFVRLRKVTAALLFPCNVGVQMVVQITGMKNRDLPSSQSTGTSVVKAVL